ncbi:MAG: hypothetical protein HYY13_01075 [Nitrospirae bacterium]|nr:hypothetical protein [Nitrospirota bacterium]
MRVVLEITDYPSPSQGTQKLDNTDPEGGCERYVPPQLYTAFSLYAFDPAISLEADGAGQYSGPGTYYSLEDRSIIEGPLEGWGCQMTIEEGERSGSFLCTCTRVQVAGCDSARSKITGRFECLGEFEPL